MIATTMGSPQGERNAASLRGPSQTVD